MSGLGKNIMKKIDAAAEELGFDITTKDFQQIYELARQKLHDEEAAAKAIRQAAQLEKMQARAEKMRQKLSKDGEAPADAKASPEQTAMEKQIAEQSAEIEGLKIAVEALPKQKRKSSAWCKYRTANKGSGMTQEELSSNWAALSAEEKAAYAPEE
jgi:beta-phosphoglucomutase-like phosphatase (HAD superfamily)